jgi:hypothetical protein
MPLGIEVKLFKFIGEFFWIFFKVFLFDKNLWDWMGRVISWGFDSFGREWEGAGLGSGRGGAIFERFECLYGF